MAHALANVFSPKEMLAELANLGVAMDLGAYRSFCLAIATVAHKGTHDRKKERNPEGNMVIPVDQKTGEPLQRDNDYDPNEVSYKRKLHTSLLRHLQLCMAGNRWIDELNLETAPSEDRYA